MTSSESLTHYPMPWAERADVIRKLAAAGHPVSTSGEGIYTTPEAWATVSGKSEPKPEPVKSPDRLVTPPLAVAEPEKVEVSTPEPVEAVEADVKPVVKKTAAKRPTKAASQPSES